MDLKEKNYYKIALYAICERRESLELLNKRFYEGTCVGGEPLEFDEKRAELGGLIKFLINENDEAQRFFMDKAF
jgi:hypothetical protein